MAAQQMANREPLAIVGIGCRLPGGVQNPADLWNLLESKTDAIIDIPGDRWNLQRYYHPNPDVPGKMYVRQGGFLQQPIDEFDAQFFGITPREAATLDPQQRILLEVTVEALEDAGIPPRALSGTRTGVYVGAFTMDNMSQQLGVHNREFITTHTSVAATMTMLANRISYTFDLQGPSLSLDTACSSSLVSFHLACQAIWNNECDVAITGGVNIMFRPEFVITMCKGRFLSPDARCKAFDASANGYVRGEGVGILVVKPLAQAQADGDNIHAVVLGTGINQDGRTNGITVPNGSAQQALMRTVLDQAGVRPTQIRYVEAHGTGTQVGDPIEATSLGTVLGEGRSQNEFCWIGSVKSNIGHLEAAAGVAGIIKTVLCLQKRAVPPNLHFTDPNPSIDFEAMPIRVPQEVVALDDGDPLIMGVNSFGYGGTNAHALLQAYDATPSQTPDERPVWLLPLSAATEPALKTMAAIQADVLAAAPSLADYHYTLSHRRDHRTHRLAVVASDQAELRHKLTAFATGELTDWLSQQSISPALTSDLVFVYTGMGPQWWGMGQELYQQASAFRAVIDECDRIFYEMSGHSLVEWFNTTTGTPMGEPIHAQPMNFAIQAALTAVWDELGVKPSAVVGHSAGEIAASYVAGCLTLEDALRVTYHRAHLMQRTNGHGRMLAVGLGIDEVREHIAGQGDVISIAANNSATSSTLAGAPEALQALADELEAEGIFAKFLRLEVAYHSYQMEPLEAEFRAALADLQPNVPRLPLYSTVSGEPITFAQQDADYWWNNARQYVHLEPAIKAIIQDGYTTFIEVGPHPVLAASIAESLRDEGATGIIVPTLRRKQPEFRSMLDTIGKLYVQGVEIDWSAHYPIGYVVPLPTYPWQHEKMWFEAPIAALDRIGEMQHPFLHVQLPTPQPTWEGEVSDYLHPYLLDHAIQGEAVFPAAGFLECAAVLGEMPLALENVELLRMLHITEAPHLRLEQHGSSFSIYSRQSREAEWSVNASGKIPSSEPAIRYPSLALTDLRASMRELQADFYARFEAAGFNYGSAFQGVRKIWAGDGEALGYIENLVRSDGHYKLHPAVLDACFQVLFGALPDADGLYVPALVQEIRIHEALPDVVWCYATVAKADTMQIEGDFVITDESGQTLVEVFGLRLQNISGQTQQSRDSWFYDLAWVPQDLTPVAAQISQRWLLFADNQGYAAQLAEKLRERGQEVVCVGRGTAFSELSPGYWEIDPTQHMDQLFDAVGDVAGIVYLWGIEQRLVDAASPEFVGEDDGLAIMRIVQDGHDLQNLFLVTSGAVACDVDETVDAPGQMVLWGMGRVLANEHGSLRTTRIDVDTPNAVSMLADDILAGSAESEIAYRGAKRYVHRLNRYVAPERDWQSPQPEMRYAIHIAQPGILNSLEYHEVERYAPQADEVEVHIKASALNFKDIMKVMNLLPDAYLENTFYGETIGLESSGTVVAVGAGVTEFAVGDDVVLFNSGGGFQSYMTVSIDNVIRKPQNVSFEDAVVYINFVTAYHGLKTVGRLQPGERVLIHSAAGGVGLAAIQVARWLGAEVYATAGTPEKRDYLRNIGVQYVSDSRSLQFVDDILRWTDGVDVVLNTLSGEALRKSFELLAPYGRFVEIGKKDIMSNSQLAMAAFDRNLIFASIDLDRMLIERPTAFNDAVQEITTNFEQEIFQPLPTEVFPAAQTADAFRLMAQAKHIGKIVVRMTPENLQIRPLPWQNQQIQADKTYLLTGGWSGLGLEIAKWLVHAGCQHLVVASRSGARSDLAQQALQDFQAAGVAVYEAKMDISDGAQVAQLLQTLQADMPPLAGIIHSAMVLDDDIVVNLNPERFARVMAPKAYGAWHLHRLTLNLPLDFFIMFSSVSAFIGNPRQANYVAANAFLDGLAHYRRAQGLPALSINWGSIAQVGAVARNPNVERYLSSLGMLGIQPEDIHQMFQELIALDDAQIIVMNMDWNRWVSSSMALALSPLYANIIKDYVTLSSEEAVEDGLIGELREMSDEERLERVANFLMGELSKVTQISTSQLHAQLHLEQLGVDSLMGVEFNNLIRKEIRIDFPVMTLMKGLTIEKLAELLLEKIEKAYEISAA